MTWDKTLTPLRDALADLYQKEEDARVVAMDAGLDLALITFDNRAINNWTNILLHAHNNEQVEDLIQVALEQFPRNTKLKNAVETYRTGKHDEISPPPPKIPEAVTVDKRLLRDAMIKAFSTEELELLCSDVQASLADQGTELQVNLEVVGGGAKPAQVLKLIEYLDRRGHLAFLVQAVRQARPGTV